MGSHDFRKFSYESNLGKTLKPKNVDSTSLIAITQISLHGQVKRLFLPDPRVKIYPYKTDNYDICITIVSIGEILRFSKSVKPTANATRIHWYEQNMCKRNIPYPR